MSMSDGGVVITGAAGGVGFAYAGEFMDRGYNVVICDVKDCSTAAKALTARHPNGKVFHTKCDVSDAKSVDKLGQFAKDNLGTIGYWINNAGVNGGRRALRDVPISQVELVVKVNLLGTLLGTKVAMDIMADQVRSDVTRCDTSVFMRETFMTLIESNILTMLLTLGWRDGSHFQHCRKRRQGRRNSRLRLLRCH
jgi:NAD(P)-dependent dehydrogenase (short-subunit alcohol dehydrogenase family)